MAEQSAALREDDKAIQYHKEALRYTPEDPTIMATLARLQMQVNDMEQCKLTCAAILQVDPNNENASVMMADLSFRKVKFRNFKFIFFLYVYLFF
jgi:Tfp pilus assembly protein PilF